MGADIGFELATQQRVIWTRQDGAGVLASRRVIDVDGPLAVDDVRARFHLATARHEVLRTTFALPAGRRVPLQVVAETGRAPELEVVDLRDRSDEERAATIAALATQSAEFDPARGPLLRATLIQSGADHHVLVLVAAALTLDSRSLGLLAQELLGGEVEEEPLQFGDYAAWQAELLEEAGPAPAGDEPATALPLAGAPTAGGPCGHVGVPVAAGVAEQLAGVGEAADVWLAAWAILLARLTGRDRVVVDVADDGRSLPEVEQALGPYARMITRTVAVDAGATLRSVTATVAAARAAGGEDLERGGAAVGAPALVGFDAAGAGSPGVAAGLDLTTRAAGDAAWPLQAVVEVRDGVVSLHHDAAALDGEAAGRVAAQLAQLVQAGAAAPEADVRTLEILPAEERAWLLDVVARGPESAGDAPLLHHCFEDQAARTPDALAVALGDQRLTYAELNARANTVAHALLAQGIGRGAAVGLLLDRSTDLISAVLGTLKAGAAYLPLNPDHPAGRLAFQLDDAGAKVVLTDSSLAAAADELPLPVLRMAELADASHHNPPRVSAPDDVVYTIYTSGSTGVPKGVENTHANLADYVAAISDRLGLADSEPLSFGVVTTMSTDLGNTSVFPALATGGRLELVPVDVAMDGAAFADYAAEHRIDVLKITPSHLGALLTGGQRGVLPHRWLILGGEAAPWALVEQVRELGSCAVLNHYGPTETTIGSLTYEVGARDGAASPAATVPIGRPLANTVVYVVDEHEALVSAGAPGELLIGGAGVARGYRNQPEQTAERFVADPFNAETGARVYRTGDLVRVLADGSIEFLHRVDGQVKIRGFRVETAEIEAVLRRHAAVQQVAVVLREDQPGDRRLVAYLAGAAAEGTADELRALARESLPDYMIPSAFVTLDGLPLTPNGKLDRAALPSPEAAAPEREYVAPRNEAEERIAAIWAEALNLERVGIHDDFFALGGHSLMATQVIARIRTSFDARLPLHALFTSPNIADLALAVGEALAPAASAEADDAELAALLQELEGLSDDEAERLLSTEATPQDHQ
jgi:amino acid adenylation domain-containing protein